MSTAHSLPPEDTDKEGIPLFAPHEKVYPRSVKGRIRTIKWTVLSLCLAIYYLLPWLRWDRGLGRPTQAFLIDMTARRAYFLDMEIWPDEIYYLAGLMILGAVALFFVTSLFGRLWCGYSCPQTVWTDLFLLTERWIEGDRAQRIRRDSQPMTAHTFMLKVAKHGVWLLIALLTGGAWVAYFNDAPTLLHNVFTGQAGIGQYFFIGLFTATTYLLAGFAREQVCTYMCPWPRFQSAMIDEETYAVSYRDWRGETRGKYRKGESWENRGDCIDCQACVAVCPTGIDIRDGLQLECIGCGLCIDACNEIMTKIERPTGLIGFDTYANLSAARRGEKPHHRFVRPRTAFYVLLLSLGVGLMGYGLTHRHTMNVTAQADRSPLFVRLSDGRVRDGYTVKLDNRNGDVHVYALTAIGLAGASLHVAERDEPPVPAEEGMDLSVRGDTIGTFHVYLETLPTGTAEQTFIFQLRDTQTGETVTHKAIFRGPTK